MILLISHFGSNKGTTDYYEQYLIDRRIRYYYLRHPFHQTEAMSSELYFFDGVKRVCVSTYSKSANPFFDLLRNTIVSLFVSFKLRKELCLLVGFGSFNVISGLIMKLLFRKKAYFWGVDYSKKRFTNTVMNRVYLGLETIACKFSDLVIQPTMRQESAREEFHGLNKEKSIVIPNGIKSISNKLTPSLDATKAFLYFGSITEQHGIIDFLKSYYQDDRNSYIPMYIFGGGDAEAGLAELLGKIKKAELIKSFGPTDHDQMISILKHNNHEYIGVAPYSDKSITDHAYFGDSLKIKEYLALGLTYLTSSVVEIPEDIRTFGIIYKTEEELSHILKNIDCVLSLDTEKTRPVLEKYMWNSLCERVPIITNEL